MANNADTWEPSVLTTRHYAEAMFGKGSPDAVDNVERAATLIAEALAEPPRAQKIPSSAEQDARLLWLHAVEHPDAPEVVVRSTVDALVRRKSLKRMLLIASMLYDKADGRLARYVWHVMQNVDRQINTCCECGVPLGPHNGRQLCGKIECLQIPLSGRERMLEVAFLHDVRVQKNLDNP